MTEMFKNCKDCGSVHPAKYPRCFKCNQRHKQAQTSKTYSESLLNDAMIEPGLKGEKGEKGEKGDPGPPGMDGMDGIDGKDGKDARFTPALVQTIANEVARINAKKPDYNTPIEPCPMCNHRDGRLLHPAYSERICTSCHMAVRLKEKQKWKDSQKSDTVGPEVQTNKETGVDKMLLKFLPIIGALLVGWLLLAAFGKDGGIEIVSPIDRHITEYHAEELKVKNREAILAEIEALEAELEEGEAE